MGSGSDLFAMFDDPGDRPGSRRSRAARARSRASLPYSRARHFAKILERRQVAPKYQPIVNIETREVLAYEALARGPEGTPLERPDLLFETARELGMVRELDWVCRASAMGTAMDAGVKGGLTLFVNVEPDVAATRAPEDLFKILRSAERDLRVVLEVTERALLDRPAELLHWLRWARERWWGVALDDVGAEPESLALLPFVNPDVIKLDFRFVRKAQLDRDEIRTIAAIHEHVERTGATILAEGIEDEEMLERAVALGATLGQGWFFGRPESLPLDLPSPGRAVPLLGISRVEVASSPWDILEAGGGEAVSVPEASVRRAFARMEQSALLSHEAPVVLGSFPAPPGPWSEPYQRFGKLRKHAAFCGALGPTLTEDVASGWHIAKIGEDEEMANEWCLAIIGAHHSEVIVAFDAGEADERGHRMLEMRQSNDRELVSRVSEFLMRKLAKPKVGLNGRLMVV